MLSTEHYHSLLSLKVRHLCALGTVVVQPVAVEDSAPPFHPIDFPYGRKTTTGTDNEQTKCDPPYQK